MEPISADAVVRSAVRAVDRLLVQDLDPRLQEVVGLWKSISDADQSLIFSIARSAVGNPVWGKDEVSNANKD